MVKGKTPLRDRQRKARLGKCAQNTETQGKQSPESSPASCSSPANDSGEEDEANMEANLKTILAEIKDFRQDNKQQLQEIKEEIGKTKKRLDEVEDRVSNTEERMQSLDVVTEELIKLQTHLDTDSHTPRSDGQRQAPEIHPGPGAERSRYGRIENYHASIV